jgi:hypothetical protein
MDGFDLAVPIHAASLTIPRLGILLFVGSIRDGVANNGRGIFRLVPKK